MWPNIKRPRSLVFPAALTAVCLIVAHDVFGRGHQFQFDAMAAVLAVTAGFLIYDVALSVLNLIIGGPALEWIRLNPPSDPDAKPYRFRLARFWWLDQHAVTNGAHLAAPVVGLSSLVALHRHDYVTVGAATALMVGLVWMGLLLIGGSINKGLFRRVMVTYARTVPISELVARRLFWWLAHAEQARHRGRGGWQRLAAMITNSLQAEQRVLFYQRWASVLIRDRTERQAIMTTAALFTATLASYASSIEAARTTEQRQQVTVSTRDHLRLALGGDLAFLAAAEAPPRKPWAWRALAKTWPAIVLAGTAIGLPHLPGVTATGATLVGAPAEVQRSIGDALKSTGSIHTP